MENKTYLNLRCNFFKNPLSVEKTEIFTFDSVPEEIILVGMSSSEEKLSEGDYDVYYGKIKNNGRFHVDLKRQNGTRVFWHIKTEKIVSETAFFDWAEDFGNAKWITATQSTEKICDFKKSFLIEKLPIFAKMRVSGLGFYDAKINEKIVDDSFFKPNFTDYQKRTDKSFIEKENYRAFYNTYDVTKFLDVGENTLRFSVSGGYFHNADRFDAPCWNFGDIRLLFSLILYYDDGKRYIVSDKDCVVSESRNRSTLYLGDRIDYRCDEEKFLSVKIMNDPILLCPSEAVDDRVNEIYTPSVLKNEKRLKIYDFGKNHTGGISCILSGKRGTKVKVRYAEVADENGSLNFLTAAYDEFGDKDDTQKSFCEQLKSKIKVIQENEYILSGGQDALRPLFNWRCYRYVEMVSDNDVVAENVVSLFIYSDIESIGNFSCSETIFNDIYEKYIQTQKCNLHCGIPMDCPHREKMPYTGDGELVISSVLYNFNAESFMNKWFNDILLSQGKDGFVPNTAPDMAVGGGYFWGYAVVKVPEILYNFTGDKYYIEKAYKAVLSWIDYLDGKHCGDYIILPDDKKWQLSDWLAPEEIKIDFRYFSTVCFYMSVKSALNMRKILFGNANERLVALEKNIKDALNARFFDREKMLYSSGIQGETVLALSCGLPDKEYVDALKNEVRRYYDKVCDNHFDTGIIMTPVLLNYFTENGMKDLAYKMMTKTDYPSFAFMLKEETTFPEHWSKKWIRYKFSDSDEFIVNGGDDTSHCHPMFGSVVSWLYEKVAGLDFSQVFDNRIVIHPYFTEEIRSAKASSFVNGIKCGVEYNNFDKFILKAEIPYGFVGKIVLEKKNTDYYVKGAQDFTISSSDCGLEIELPSGKWSVFEK